MGDRYDSGGRQSGFSLFSLLLLWVLATVVGALAGQSLPGAIFKDIKDIKPLVDVPDVFLVGISIGFAQWLLLREAATGVAIWEWVIATGLGLFAGATAVVVLDTWFVHNTVSNFLLYAIGGAIFGFAEWIVLSQYFRRSGWWVLITTITGVLIYWISEADLPMFTGDVYAFAVAGTLTGIGIIWLLQEPIRAEE